MFRIAICDDSVSASAELTNCIRELAEEISLEANVDVYRSFKTLYRAIQNEEYQLLILETVVAGCSGIEFAKMLRGTGSEAEIVFNTSTAEYALEAYSCYPAGYMLKPPTKKKMRDLFRHVTGKYMKKPAVVLKTRDGEKISVNVEQIRYIEVFRTELDVHCEDDVKPCVGSLTEVFSALPPSQFYRSHRSYIVNLGYVTKMSKYSFTMQNGDKVTIAKNRYAEARAKFEDFVGSV